MSATTLTISRTDQLVNKGMKIEIRLDGKKLYDIDNGETKTFDIPMGPHRLLAKIDWCGSLPVTFIADEGKEVRYELGSPVQGKKRPYYLGYIYLAIFFGGALLNHFYHLQILFQTAIIIALLWMVYVVFFTGNRTLYYLTFGRNKYLYLKEVG